MRPTPQHFSCSPANLIKSSPTSQNGTAGPLNPREGQPVSRKLGAISCTRRSEAWSRSSRIRRRTAEVPAQATARTTTRKEYFRSGGSRRQTTRSSHQQNRDADFQR